MSANFLCEIKTFSTLVNVSSPQFVLPRVNLSLITPSRFHSIIFVRNRAASKIHNVRNNSKSQENNRFPITYLILILCLPLFLLFKSVHLSLSFSLLDFAVILFTISDLSAGITTLFSPQVSLSNEANKDQLSH